jgi:hypothetical protein
MPKKKLKTKALTERGNVIKGHVAPGGTDQERPIFSFYMLQPKFDIRSCNETEKARLADRIHRLSELTWEKLRNAPKLGLGYEKISRNSINVAIPSHITEDVNIISFRCWGKAPMIGYRQGQTLHIIWLDPKFAVYDH